MNFKIISTICFIISAITLLPAFDIEGKQVNKKTITTQRRDSSSSVYSNFNRKIISYNQSSDTIMVETILWDTLKNSWYLSNAIHYGYETSGKRNQYSSQTIQTRIKIGRNWIDTLIFRGYRCSLTYDPRGNIIDSIVQSSGNDWNSWNNNIRVTKTFDSVGNLIERIEYTYANNGWQPKLKYVKSYHNDGLLKNSQTYSFLSAAWSISLKDTLLYNEDGKITEHSLYTWTGVKWEQNYRYLYYYDQYGYQTASQQERWFNNQLVSRSRDTSYYYNGHLTRVDRGLRQDGDRWLFSDSFSSDSTIFNEKDQIILYAKKNHYLGTYISGSDTGSFPGYSTTLTQYNNRGLVTFNEVFDSAMNIFSGYLSFTAQRKYFKYDSDNRIIEVEEQNRNANSFSWYSNNKSLTTYHYDEPIRRYYIWPLSWRLSSYDSITRSEMSDTSYMFEVEQISTTPLTQYIKESIEYSLQNNQSSREEAELTTNLSVSLVPNPFNPTTKISVKNAKTHSYISIYNIAGKRVADLTVTPTNSEVIWNAKALGSGFYLVRVKSSGKTIYKKILLNR